MCPPPLSSKHIVPQKLSFGGHFFRTQSPLLLETGVLRNGAEVPVNAFLTLDVSKVQSQHYFNKK